MKSTNSPVVDCSNTFIYTCFIILACIIYYRFICLIVSVSIIAFYSLHTHSRFLSVQLGHLLINFNTIGKKKGFNVFRSYQLINFNILTQIEINIHVTANWLKYVVIYISFFFSTHGIVQDFI